MNKWIEICHVDDLQPDSGICALVAGQQVAIFYLTRERSVYALSNYDPFCHANVLSRGMVGDLGGEPMVASPMYKQHFSLKTGACLEHDQVRVATYEVRIDKDRIAVNVRQ